MDVIEKLRARHAWRSAFASAALNALVTPMDIYVGRRIENFPRWAPVTSALTGAAIVIWLLYRRKRQTRGSVVESSIAFMLNNVVIVASLWVTSGAYARWSDEWTAPFQANRLGALAAPLLAPELLPGLLMVVMFIGAPIIRYMTFAPNVKMELGGNVVPTLIVYGVFGAAILWFRWCNLKAEREKTVAQSDATASQKLARTLILLRDLSNTPLQVVELVAGGLSRNWAASRADLDKMDRAVRRLRKLNQLLSTYESRVGWRPGDESFDAHGELKEASTLRPTPETT